jgi:hypothetical protein
MAVARHQYHLCMDCVCRSFFYIGHILTRVFHYAVYCSKITLGQRIFSTNTSHLLVNGAITPMQRTLQS